MTSSGAEARDHRVVPRVTFTDPVASVGLTEREARDDGRDVIASVARFEDNESTSRARPLVKLVADGDGQLFGGHIVGEEAGH